MKLPEKSGEDRDAQVLRLREQGLNYRQIAQRLDISPSTAHKAAQRAMKRESARYGDEAGLAGVMIIEQLDHLLFNLWPFTKAGVIRDPETGESHPIPPAYEAVDRVLKIIDSKKKLLGLDKEVVQFEVGTNANMPTVDGDGSQQEMTPELYAKEVLRELIKVGAVTGPTAEFLLNELGPGDLEEIIDVESEEEDREVEIPSLTYREPRDEPPEWVDEDDYVPHPGDWVPDELGEVEAGEPDSE